MNTFIIHSIHIIQLFHSSIFVQNTIYMFGKTSQSNARIKKNSSPHIHQLLRVDDPHWHLHHLFAGEDAPVHQPLSGRGQVHVLEDVRSVGKVLLHRLARQGLHLVHDQTPLPASLSNRSWSELVWVQKWISMSVGMKYMSASKN